MFAKTGFIDNRLFPLPRVLNIFGDSLNTFLLLCSPIDLGNTGKIIDYCFVVVFAKLIPGFLSNLSSN